MYALFPNQSLLTQYLSHTELPTASVITQVFLPLVPLSQMFPLGGPTSLHPSDLNLNVIFSKPPLRCVPGMCFQVLSASL